MFKYCCAPRCVQGKQNAYALRVVLRLALLLLCLSVCACEETSPSDVPANTSAQHTEQETKKEPSIAQAPAKANATQQEQTQSGAVRVYTMPTLQEPASPAEIDQAQLVVDYANLVGEVLNQQSCGTAPFWLQAAVENYRSLYIAEEYHGARPDEHSIATQLVIPEGISLSRIEDLRADYVLMDKSRTAMFKDYDALCAYVRDTTIRDDGVKGQALSEAILASYASFAAAKERVLTSIDKDAEQAQDVLLRDHPLREQVKSAKRLVTIFQQLGNRIGLIEPDPVSLAALMQSLDDELIKAERMPFVIPGEVEMYYRYFLKEARLMQATIRRGMVESFHAEVRSQLNTYWNSCRSQYNLFVQALAKQ